MEKGVWTEPITFATPKLGKYLTIGSTAEAARVLLDHWPVEKGKALKKAKHTCLEVLQGMRPAEDARAAVMTAAKEAGINVHEE
jgi:hypothetical protein